MTVSYFLHIIILTIKQSFNRLIKFHTKKGKIIMMKKTYLVEDLCCAHCASKIETKVRDLDGVISANLNFIAQKLVVEIEDRIADTITASVCQITAKIEPDATVEEQ